jgi:hypothetical protein
MGGTTMTLRGWTLRGPRMTLRSVSLRCLPLFHGFAQATHVL